MADEIDRRTKNRFKSISGLPGQTGEKDRIKLFRINGKAQRKSDTVNKIYNFNAVSNLGILYF